MKVLDFGLAKLGAATAAAARLDATRRRSRAAATRDGMILGTAAYMSPEQAAGKAADKRSDLWAFGVVLLEMLTGRPVFTGETESDVLAAVLKTRAGLDNAARRDARTDSQVAPAVPGEGPHATARFRHRRTIGDRRRADDVGP